MLPGGEANLDFIRLVVEQEHDDRPLGVDGLLLLNALRQERVLSTDEAASLIQKIAAEARAVLGRLVEEGLIEASGETKARVWRLSAAVYRRLDWSGAGAWRGREPAGGTPGTRSFNGFR